MSNTKIFIQPFGKYNNQKVEQYILQNKSGLLVKLINYGATITAIQIPDANGRLKNIACGFDTLEGYFSNAYQNNAPYFGCTVGRYASRIKDGKFSLEGVDYTLAVNNGSNHLHGGLKGFDKKVWEAKVVDLNGEPAVQMHLQSPHMEEGYPGNVSVKVWFSLSEENEINIQYEATTDKATPLSLTNHTYFNLSGFRQTIAQHRVQIAAEKILVPDETNVPVGKIASVNNTSADLQNGRLLGDCFNEMETGFEHFYLFDKPIGNLTKVAEFQDTESGLTLEISTTEPGVLFYTGYFTSPELKRENGEQYGRYRGFCFETSRYPNGPNLPNSPDSITHPGEIYKSQTLFKVTDPKTV